MITPSQGLRSHFWPLLLLAILFSPCTKAQTKINPNQIGPGTVTSNITHSGTETFSGPLNSNNLSAGNVANKPATSDGFMFVSVNGNNANDGQSWGSAKASVQTAGFLYEFLGSGTFTTTSQINLGQSVILYGQGVNTVIKAVAGFPASTAVVHLSSVNASEYSQLNNMNVDCGAQTSSIGVLNDQAQEISWLSGVTVKNCPNIGIDFEGSGSQNMGLENVSVTYDTTSPGTSSAGTIPVKINTAGPTRGIHGITINATGQTTPPTKGILIQTAGTYWDVHCETVTICIDVNTSDVVLKNIQCHPSVTDCVRIESGIANVTIENVTTNGTNLVNDIGNSIVLTPASDPAGLGWYMVGANGSPQGACSSSTNVICNTFKKGITTGISRSTQHISDQGTACTNGELALSAGWQSTGSATVTAVAGNGQTCSWTITTGTTTAANPTVTDTLTNALPAATTRCWMFLEYGPASTHTAAAGEGFAQTTLSATAPVFTFNGTPTAAGKTYLVVRTCGP